jgi:hypothetical protein
MGLNDAEIVLKSSCRQSRSLRQLGSWKESVEVALLQRIIHDCVHAKFTDRGLFLDSVQNTRLRYKIVANACATRT